MMSPHRIALSALLVFAAFGARAAAHMYRYDTVHSQIEFGVGHDGYSQALGMLHIKAGWLRFDPDDWSSSATVLDIDLTGVDMGDAQWSKTVREASLLDAGEHPLAHFASTSVEKTGPGVGLMHGNLTLRGITRPVAIAFRVNRIGATIFEMRTVAGFSGSAQLDRNAFGITRNPGSIGRTVDVRLEIEALRDHDARSHYQAQTDTHAAAQ